MDANTLRFENAKNKLDTDFSSGWAVIMELSDAGNEEAMKFVADCYYRGVHVEMDEPRAYELFHRIVSMYPDNGAIWEKIADCHFYGYGVPKSHESAISKYEDAWQHGYVDAASDIGWIYAFGDITPNDERTAAKWFQRAADKGSAAGKYFMGYFYDNGYGGLPQSQKLAHKYLSEAAAEDNYSAVRYLLRARCFGDEAEYVKILDKMTRMADEGKADVQYDLGISYLVGAGVEKDAYKAQELLQKSADAGNYEAILELGKQLVDYDSEFITDPEKGHKYLLAAAENGSADAMYELYRYYSYHEHNKPKAIYWAERSVESGKNTFIRKDIADFYYNDGNITDYQKAIKYYEAVLADGADYEHDQVFLPLAVCYLKKGDATGDHNRIMSLLQQAKQLSEAEDDYYNKPRKGEIIYWIAYMTEHGLGTAKNLELAFQLYTQSAAQGYGLAGVEASKFKKTLFGWKKM
ncbi:MAG: SEL1-like repeat protein [Blautia sp.]|nr:SEL1-like repeat protein [Blautia sp.]